MLAAITAVFAACTAPGPPTPPTTTNPSTTGSTGAGPGTTVAPVDGCASSRRPPARDAWTVDVVGGGTRSTLVRVPDDYRPGRPSPVLVSLHPFALDAVAWEQYSGLADAAAARGFIVVSPQGTRFADLAPRWAVRGGFAAEVDDVAFIAALIDRTAAELCIDPGRVVAAGFSAGAAMTHTLSCGLPGRFLAVAGSGGMNLSTPCPETPGPSALVIHGRVDPIVPTSGSTVVPPVRLSVDDTAASLARRAGCAPNPTTTVDGRQTTQRWTGCQADRRVEQVMIDGMGHVWAGRDQGPLAGIVGPGVPSPDANTLVLDFLEAAGA